jgi:hypothetical protein
MRRSRRLGGYELKNGLFVPSLVKSIQRGTIALAGATTNAATINAVNMANSRLRLVSLETNNGGGFNALTRLTLTNATTITATRTGAGGTDVTIGYEITEYWPGVLRSVQRGSITVGPAATSNTATINAVNTAKTELSCLGFESDEASNSDQYLRIAQTSAATITATRNGGAGAAGTSIVSYEAVEFF